MNGSVFLNELRRGQAARVLGLSVSGPVRRRLQDMGLTEGTLIFCVQESPLGDPRAFRIRGAVVALRGEDAAKVLVEPYV
ncbi:MAG: ferrous iron transport protein A [Firmicutes bacterium]|nr:ferrous iron transport protein A [Bacillota bacterium]